MTMHHTTMRGIAVVREMTGLGMTRQWCAARLDVPYPTLIRWCRLGKIQAPYGGDAVDAQRAIAKKRAVAMSVLYKAGYTLQQIGDQHGLTRERVRQLMTRHLGFNAESGGAHAKAVAAEKKREAAKNARKLAKHGCSFQQWSELQSIGNAMIAAGKGRYQTPLYAFRNQRRNAAHRGIGWDLTLWQWWCIWKDSGHWEDRGRGQGYVMCRYGDTGPYAPGNVFIALATENCSEANRRETYLPMGVSRTKSGRFHAHRRINGRDFGLGTHDTPELAHAAYLAAGEQFARAA